MIQIDMSARTLPEWVPCLPLGDVRDLVEQVTQGRTTEADELFPDEVQEARYFMALAVKIGEQEMPF
jgi:hypothetical protein